MFGSEVPLLAGRRRSGLYEWEAGAPLKLVSLLPGLQANRRRRANRNWAITGRDVRGAISDGRVRGCSGRTEREEGPLYMRDTVKDETIQVNAAQGEGVTEAERRR